MLASTACTTPPRVQSAPDTISSLAREPRIVAVHYHDLGTRGPLRDDTSIVRVRWVLMAAPTGVVGGDDHGQRGLRHVAGSLTGRGGAK
jgi:hypothetical protein